MKAKKTKTTKQPQKCLKEVVEVLERIEAVMLTLAKGSKVEKLDLSASTIHEQDAKDVEVGKTEEETKQHLINQSGEAVELTYDLVKEEAQKLVSIDEHGEQRGFAKAKEIIIAYGVSRLEDVPKEKYSEIVAQFRKAVKEWK